MKASRAAAPPVAPKVLVSEVFYSLQGESTTVGLPTVFIRLSGCPRRCRYCDTSYAFYGGERRSIAELLTEVGRYQTSYVTVTGGEPLAQNSCYPLLSALGDAGYQVSLETSGTVPLKAVDPRTVIVMDLKTPSSGEMEHNCYENISILGSKDQIKFVIANAGDYIWASEITREYRLTDRVGAVLFSPCYRELKEQTLADWILRDQLAVRMQIQLHKFLWGDVPGR